MRDYTFKATRVEYITVTADNMDNAYDVLEDNHDVEDADVKLYEVSDEYK